MALSLTVMATFAWAQDANFPRLQNNGKGMQLIIDGQPFLMLGGELHNSTAGSAHYIAPVWKQMADKNLNTVIDTVSWE